MPANIHETFDELYARREGKEDRTYEIIALVKKEIADLTYDDLKVVEYLERRLLPKLEEMVGQ